MSNFNDDQIYIEFSKYDTDILRETFKRSADQIKIFDKLVEEKISKHNKSKTHIEFIKQNSQQ